MLTDYKNHAQERINDGIPPKPLSLEQTRTLIETIMAADDPQHYDFLYTLLSARINPGVDDAAKIKAQFLFNITQDKCSIPFISKEDAVALLGTMQGGYNIAPLIELLDHPELSPLAIAALSKTYLIFDAFSIIEEKAKSGHQAAKQVLEQWADATWFTSRPVLAEKLTLTVFKVNGEVTTDDLSPAQEAWSRPDIPLHAFSMLYMPREGITPDSVGQKGPVTQFATLKEKGYPIVFVADIVGTGSSRKSATNSLLWYIGDNIPFIPNKRTGGVVLGGKIAPIFYNTLEDSGSLPIELDVKNLSMGDVIDVYPYLGEVRHHDTQALISTFSLKKHVLLDEVQAGGRIPLIIGRRLTQQARKALNRPLEGTFRQDNPIETQSYGYTLAQKMIGRACGKDGVRPGEYCEPVTTTVGSQDTTGAMTRDEVKDLACLTFSSDLVMQSFCHTAAYPKPVDIQLHQSLPDFMIQRGGVVLKTGDGIIHSWLNRMLLPDTVGTGGDSHTRFPIGISFPAGSGLVAFAAASGIMPLDMPESVLVRFSGELQPGITLRDLVHAIPYAAIQKGLLTVDKKGKKNVFSGRVLEIEGLPFLSVEQAFELADASAERSAAASTIKLDRSVVERYIRSNVTLLSWLVKQGYQNQQTLKRRIAKMQQWLDNPQLLEADADAQYHCVIDIDLNEIKEPLLCCPNDPDDVKPLSALNNQPIYDVFIGSCMTNIGHFRAAATLLSDLSGPAKSRLWLAPPTKMDAEQLKKEGYFSYFIRAGARIEPAGCSLCMGNQARVNPHSVVVSTSTRNFPNRLGNQTDVFLASAELAAICAKLGHLPNLDEYRESIALIEKQKESIYRYMNFDLMEEYQ